MEVVALQAVPFDGHLHGRVFQHAAVVGLALKFQPQVFHPVGLLDQMVQHGRTVRRRFHLDVQMVVQRAQAVHVVFPALLPQPGRSVARQVVAHFPAARTEKSTRENGNSVDDFARRGGRLLRNGKKKKKVLEPRHAITTNILRRTHTGARVGVARAGSQQRKKLKEIDKIVDDYSGTRRFFEY